MKINKKEDQSVDTLFLLRMGNKIPMEGVTETKFRGKMEGSIYPLAFPLLDFLVFCKLYLGYSKFLG